MLLHYYLRSLKQFDLKLNKQLMNHIIYFRYIRRRGSVKKCTLNTNFFLPEVQISQLVHLYTNFSQNEVSNYLELNDLWFHMYKQLYFGKIFKISTELKNINVQQVIPQSTLLYMMHAVRSIRWKKYYITHSNEILEVLFLSLWLKNLTLFMGWMRKYFERINLKKHKKLFLLLKFLLGRLIWNYNIFLKLKGLRVVLRGKFSKAGSVRKTRKYIRRGKCSYTSKNIALINQTNVIRTLTGVFSIKMEVFFKKWCLL